MEKHTSNKSCSTESCGIAWVVYSQYSKENIEMQKSWIVESPKMMSNQANPSSMMEWNRTKEEVAMEKNSMMKNDSMMKADEKK